MNLYQIEQELLDLYNQIEENGGEITPELEERLVITQENFSSKLENYAKFVKSLEGNINLMDSEIERISKLKQTKQNLINRLENNMLNALRLFGNKDPQKDIWRYELPTFKLSTRKSQSVEIPDENIVPRNYSDWSLSKLTYQELDSILENINEEHHIIKGTVSKTRIKEDILAGQEVEGAELKTNYSLQIK